MASRMWLRMGESAKTNVEFYSILMSPHRFRKVCIDMACGKTVRNTIPTSHHPCLGVLVDVLNLGNLPWALQMTVLKRNLHL